MNQTLLVELLTEELPPKALAKLGEAFAAGIADGLKSRAFLETTSIATSYATPRRLAVSITNVRATSPDKPRHEKVLPVSVALDGNGNPTPSLLKKWASMGFNGVPDIAELERRIDGKQEFLFYSGTAKGSSLQVGLLSALDQTIAALPIPKVMTYQRPNGKDVSFVRPVQKLLALHGKDVIPAFVFGDDAALDADRVTLGHRFLAPGAITLDHADEYAAVLQSQGKVIASFSQRREKIRAALLAAAGDDEVLMPDALLDEVTSLVEWPAVYTCNFESQFLSVPQECLILTMQTNQKYFALTDKSGRLRSRFLIVSNIETATPSHIIEGNERVVRPRLSDAKFFFEQDQKKRLEDRIPGLASVVYHNKLGTQGERSLRVRTLASLIALASGSDAHGEALAQRAASLAKTDLLTDMVGEFPELQGIMGTYYARHDGEPEEVALAISEHYQPRFAGDALPATPTGTTVALADKLETLVGIWGIGLQPTGDRDPFALRRHALGVLRMLIEKRLPLSLQQLLTDAAQLFAGNPNFKDPTADVTSFLHDRLRGLLRDRGFQPNEIEAVVAQQPDRLDNIVERLEAVRAFAALPEAEALAAANKRITNILKKVEGEIGAPDHSLCTEAAEKDLVVAVARVKIDVNAAFAKADFTGTLKALSVLRDDVDRFFNDVMVMAEDPVLRANRIALLSELHGMMNRVADISRLAA